jgi:hypothetical protein
MTIQEALEIVVFYAKPALSRRGSKPRGSLDDAIAVVEIMLTEEAFFTAYQTMTVEEELAIQAEEAGDRP